MRLLLCPVLVALLSLLCSTTALADDADAEEAAELTRLAQTLSKQGRHERALQYFQLAKKRHATFVTQANLAMAELNAERYRDAANHLSEILRLLPPSHEDGREALSKGLKRARQHVLTLVIGVDIGGAAIHLDGEVVGVSPLQGPVFVDPGKHRVHASKQDRRSDSQLVEGRAGEQQGIGLVIATDPIPRQKKKESPPDESSGNFSVKDGLLTGGLSLTATALVSAAISTAMLVSLADDFDEFGASINAATDNASNACANPTSEVALLCAKRADAFNNGRVWQDVMIASWVSTGVSGVGTLAVWLFMDDVSDAVPITTRLQVAPTGWMFEVQGSF